VVLLAILLWAVAEIVAFVAVADHIGVLLAIILVLGVSAAGPFLVRRAGTGVVEQARQRIQRGESPNREVLDGVVLLLGGVLVCVPGFIGDALGILLLIGPVRHAVIRVIGRRLGRRVAVATNQSFIVFGGRRPGRGGRVVDAATHDPSAPVPRDQPTLPRPSDDEPPAPS
jgi:UPF0716 protein FxsA